MNKILPLTFLFLSLCTTVSIQAQDILFEELFDDSTLGQFTEFSEVGDGEKWRARDFNDKFFAEMNGFNDGVQDNLDWLISPALDMSMYDDEVLTFENASNFSGPDLEVLISEDYSGEGDPSAATWTDITAGVNFSPGGYEYVDSGEIDLSGPTGTAYIAFRYTSSPEVQGKAIQIDSVVVSATIETTNTTELEVQQLISSPYISNDNLLFSVITSDVIVSVSNIEGNLLPQINNKIVSGNVAIPVGDLPNGVYVLLVSNGVLSKSIKFIK